MGEGRECAVGNTACAERSGQGNRCRDERDRGLSLVVLSWSADGVVAAVCDLPAVHARRAGVAVVALVREVA